MLGRKPTLRSLVERLILESLPPVYNFIHPSWGRECAMSETEEYEEKQNAINALEGEIRKNPTFNPYASTR